MDLNGELWTGLIETNALDIAIVIGMTLMLFGILYIIMKLNRINHSVEAK